jgi:outer membrane protein assembly factor BamB
LIVALGGVTLGVDARGQIAWVRKQVTLPVDEDPRWVLQHYHRPLVAGNRIILSQPGTRSVLALEPATGLKQWETLIPDVLGCWGLSQGAVICQTESGVQALDVGTGKRKWFAPLTDLQPHALVDEQHVLVARKGIKADNKHPVIELTWLDAASGNIKGTTQLATLTDALPRLGVLVPYKDRLFTFFGKGQHDPNRDVVELIPSGPIKP